MDSLKKERTTCGEFLSCTFLRRWIETLKTFRYYSERTLDILGEYMQRFPDLFNHLAVNDNSSKDMFQVEDVFGDRESGVTILTELANW